MIGKGINVLWMGMGLKLIFLYKMGWIKISYRFKVREIEKEGKKGFIMIENLVEGNLRGLGLDLKKIWLKEIKIVMKIMEVGKRIKSRKMMEEREKKYVRNDLGKGMKGRRILLKKMIRNDENKIMVKK